MTHRPLSYTTGFVIQLLLVMLAIVILNVTNANTTWWGGVLGALSANAFNLGRITE